MAEILIIADDLTGAIETGVQLSKQDIVSKVILKPNTSLGSILTDKETTAVIINIESRHLDPSEAAKKVTKVLKIAKRSGIKWFYKKTDSTLRGNIGAELEAFLHGTNQSTLPFIPALPRLKRYTKDGYQFIGETLLHNTVFAQDPLEPISNSFVPEILRKQTDLEIGILSIEEISEPGFAVSPDKKIVVFDCQSEADLKIIGKFASEKGWQKAMAGTAGMVETLPELLQLSKSGVNAGNLRGPLLLINGSLNSMSFQQVLHARENGVSTITLAQHLLKDPNLKVNPEYQEIIRKIKGELVQGSSVILNTSDLGLQGENPSLDVYNSGKDFFQSVSIQIGKIVSDILNDGTVHTLCVFGGDTLTGIIDLLGCESIEPQSELFTGVALASIQSKFGKISLLSKPGGYGHTDLILQIINHIKKTNK